MAEKEIDTGGAAFPFFGLRDAANDGEFGMSLRDYFAAKAMQGYLGIDPVSVTEAARLVGDEPTPWIANASYRMADAMIAARKAGAKS